MLLPENFNSYRTMSVNQLLLLAVLYIVAIDNNTMWSTLWKALGGTPVTHSVFIVSFFVFVTTLTLLLLSIFSFNRTIKVAITAAFISASAIAYFIDNMHVIISVSMIQNVFETDFSEASELINASMVWHLMLFGVFPSLLVWFVEIDKKTLTSELISRIKLLSIMTLVATLTVFWTYKDYSLVLRQNKSMRYLVNPVYPTVSLIKYLTAKDKHKNKPITPVFDDAAQYSTVGADNRKDILVIVVGETARADNFSLNGYARNTNPLLRKENIINYGNTASCGTATAESVPCMFSDLSRDNFSTGQARQRENLLDGFKNAGLNVLWRDNNSSCKGVCARVASEDLTNMQVEELCNDEECFDEILLHKLDEYVNSLKNNSVIVLHQKGSHGPAYYKRYPEAFAKFTPACQQSSVHNCGQDEIRNAYDNTILYSDYFLSKVINYLKAHSEKFNTAMIYMSDHGESLGENGIYLHGLPYFIAPEEQTHVPFIVWLSENTIQQKHIDTECLKNNSQQPYSHDNLMHSALGLMDISTKAYKKNMDIFAGCRTYKMVRQSVILPAESS